MSIEALIVGKVYRQAVIRHGNNSGRPFAVATIRAASGEGEGYFVNVLAFSQTVAGVLLALNEGDSVGLSGTLKPGVRIDAQGQPRPTLDLIADQVLTLYGLKKKRGKVNPSTQDADSEGEAHEPY